MTFLRRTSRTSTAVDIAAVDAVAARRIGTFEIEAVSTIFISAPFLAPISVALADAVHRIERAVQLHAGSLLVVEATPLPASEPGF